MRAEGRRLGTTGACRKARKRPYDATATAAPAAAAEPGSRFVTLTAAERRCLAHTTSLHSTHRSDPAASSTFRQVLWPRLARAAAIVALPA
jgi:hypothetical protein